MHEVLANVAGAFGLAAGFTVFTNLSLQAVHSRRHYAAQFLFLFAPILALMLWYAVPVSQALVVGATGGAIAGFFLVGLVVARRLDRDVNSPGR